MITPDKLREDFADCEDWIVEGYWELADTAAKVNAARGDREKAEQCQALAETCEDMLRARWSDK